MAKFKNLDSTGTTENFYLDMPPNTADLQFMGKMLGRHKWEPDHNKAPNVTITVYLTSTDKFVCIREKEQDDEHTLEHHICDDADGVVEFFKHGWLSKQLYETIGLNAARQL